MLKLIRGIAEFREKARPGYAELFTRLALGQQPDALFIACSDSRVVPNTFASTDPGDLFVIRNIGNVIPPSSSDAATPAWSEAAAIEFAVSGLGVSDLIVCGHSQCGAMKALLAERDPNSAVHRWLQFGEPSLERLRSLPANPNLEQVNQLSQINVLQQLEHLRTYPAIRERVAEGKLRLHGWWFDIGHAEVQYYDEDQARFIVIDEQVARHLLQRFGGE
jgi:carbonic anhydrase